MPPERTPSLPPVQATPTDHELPARLQAEPGVGDEFGDALDEWMLAAAMQRSSLDGAHQLDDDIDDVLTNSPQPAEAVRTDTGADVADSPPHAHTPASGGRRWAAQVAALESMGFEEARALEMLDLCGGDVQKAVQLLVG